MQRHLAALVQQQQPRRAVQAAALREHGGDRVPVSTAGGTEGRRERAASARLLRRARARGTMVSSMGTFTSVAAASPWLPKPKNDRRVPVVGSALAEVGVHGLRTFQSRRHPEMSSLFTCSGRMAMVRSQTNGSISQQKSARVAGLFTSARTRHSSPASKQKKVLQSLPGGRPPRRLCPRAARSKQTVRALKHRDHRQWRSGGTTRGALYRAGARAIPYPRATGTPHFFADFGGPCRWICDQACVVLICSIPCMQRCRS